MSLDDVQMGRIRRAVRHLARRYSRQAALRCRQSGNRRLVRVHRLGCDMLCQDASAMFFGTQTGQMMQMDRTGYDNGVPYVCDDGWRLGGVSEPSQTITWKQARAVYHARASQPFEPQLTAPLIMWSRCRRLPLPRQILACRISGTRGCGIKPSGMRQDQAKPAVRNTGWVSIGMTGFSHAPVVQVTVAQQVKPEVELISIAATFERLAITV